jgi:chorismate dehydratase
MKRIGIVPHLFAQPLFYGLRRQEDPPAFELVESSHAGTAELAIKLRQAQLAGAFLSPIDYAREYSRCRIVPSVCVCSEEESAAVCLVFHAGLPRVESIAIDPSAGSEVVLAHLIFAEKYDSAPTMVPMAGTVDQALEQTDAVLLLGDSARKVRGNKQKLDLVDEWKDMTGLPYVHGFWVAPEETLSPSELRLIVESGHQGAAHLEDFSPDTAYLSRFGYQLNEEALSGLSEYFRMAFYHGILKDLPDIKLYTLDEHPPAAVRLN